RRSLSSPAPPPGRILGRIADRCPRVLADGHAAHTRSYRCSDDGTDGRACNGDWTYPKFVQRLNDVNMRKTTRAAPAKSNREGRIVRLRTHHSAFGISGLTTRIAGSAVRSRCAA